jgi:uncharacterized protein (TIGR02466 family)
MDKKVLWAETPNLEIWWGTPVWFYDIPIHNIDTNKLELECYKIMDKEETVHKSNINGWQSKDFNKGKKETPALNKLIKEVISKSSTVFSKMGIKPEFKCELNNAWININKKGSCNMQHIHPESIISAVFYVKSDDDSGDLFIEDDTRQRYINELITYANNPLTYNTVSYKPKKGRLIIFPSWITHGVGLNKSKHDRISIAFNIGKL